MKNETFLKNFDHCAKLAWKREMKSWYLKWAKIKFPTYSKLKNRERPEIGYIINVSLLFHEFYYVPNFWSVINDEKETVLRCTFKEKKLDFLFFYASEKRDNNAVRYECLEARKGDRTKYGSCILFLWSLGKLGNNKEKPGNYGKKP